MDPISRTTPVEEIAGVAMRVGLHRYHGYLLLWRDVTCFNNFLAKGFVVLCVTASLTKRLFLLPGAAETKASTPLNQSRVLRVILGYRRSDASGYVLHC